MSARRGRMCKPGGEPGAFLRARGRACRHLYRLSCRIGAAIHLAWMSEGQAEAPLSPSPEFSIPVWPRCSSLKGCLPRLRRAARVAHQRRAIEVERAGDGPMVAYLRQLVPQFEPRTFMDALGPDGPEE